MTRLALGSSLLGMLITAQAVKAAEPSQSVSPADIILPQSEPSAQSPLLVDGVFVYGQSPQPDQAGAAYMVFEAQDGLAVGAFYMPNSSFDCFYGSLQPDQAALMVVDSYSQEVFPYSLALLQQAVAADVNGAAPVEFNLEGFHRLNELSEVDRNVLAVCKADLQDRIW
ncbi:MAG: hypothetical protein HC886_09185 [Leptolyngbyaceae cyanobacterium SM1_1_3]|nr:hypothetical protein [Leptolyngbyaceae cyanobacterium SM1_1_3]NJN02740.1 hypothetical protein [Leptolyngbyaceae cyanobacterium RM1_1_2]